jgi:hypothetical protein
LIIAATIAARCLALLRRTRRHAGRHRQELAELAGRHVLGAVAVHDVADLVAEHAGELSFVFELSTSSPT